MRINLALQLTEDPSFRCPKVRISTGSAFVVELCGIPAYIAGRAVEAVSVTVTNADGFNYTASCAKFLGDWCAAIPASHFGSYGFIAHGLHVSIALAASGGSGSSPSVPAAVTTLTRDIEIIASSASAEPGDPSKSIARKGDDIYIKTSIVEGAQHYTKMEMVYDARVGWGATWSGDYVLVDGEFQEAN